MGTNFYWMLDIPDQVTLPTGDTIDRISSMFRDDPLVHIGKRSAAGPYCFDCNITLCEGGPEAVHLGTYGFSKECPICGQKNAMDDCGGVGMGHSFIWAQDPDRVIATCNAFLPDKIISDEYWRTYTGGEFIAMRNSLVRIEFHHSIGKKFF